MSLEKSSELSSPKIISGRHRPAEIHPTHPKKHLSKSYGNKIEIINTNEIMQVKANYNNSADELPECTLDKQTKSIDRSERNEEDLEYGSEIDKKDKHLPNQKFYLR